MTHGCWPRSAALPTEGLGVRIAGAAADMGAAAGSPGTAVAAGKAGLADKAEGSDKAEVAGMAEAGPPLVVVASWAGVAAAQIRQPGCQLAAHTPAGLRWGCQAAQCNPTVVAADPMAVRCNPMVGCRGKNSQPAPFILPRSHGRGLP